MTNWLVPRRHVLLVASLLLLAPLVLAAQGGFPSDVAGVIGNWNPAQAGRTQAAGLGFDYGVMKLSPGGRQGTGYFMGFGYDRITRYQGGRMDFQAQYLFAPQPIRDTDNVNSLLYADGGIGLHIGAPTGVTCTVG